MAPNSDRNDAGPEQCAASVEERRDGLCDMLSACACRMDVWRVRFFLGGLSATGSHVSGVGRHCIGGGGISLDSALQGNLDSSCGSLTMMSCVDVVVAFCCFLFAFLLRHACMLHFLFGTSEEFIRV